jgi:hypothetical protein
MPPLKAGDEIITPEEVHNTTDPELHEDKLVYA